MVKGFASAEGSPAHNIKLSVDRANAVKAYLLNLGVKASQIKTKGYGEMHALSNNATEEGRILNRRVEIE
jgi:OOP family OmpA-OmpF porin